MMALNSQNWLQMRKGLGKMNSETEKAEQMICHTTTTLSSSNQGDQNSICFWFMTASALGCSHCFGAWPRCARAIHARCR